MENNPNCSFEAWKSKYKSCLKNNIQQTNNTVNSHSDLSKLHLIVHLQTRSNYLAQKYGKKWKDKVTKGIFNKMKLSDNCWIRAVIFNSSSRSARQVTCNILEDCCSTFIRKKNVAILKKKSDQLLICSYFSYYC